MVKEFKNLSQFANHLRKVTKEFQEKEIKALWMLGEHLENKAKAIIDEGILQQGGGEYASWAELADSTKAEKDRLGYAFTDDYNPLLRTGSLRDSIKHIIRSEGAIKQLSVGSDEDIMVWQELGTFRIPPRSVLGLTFFREHFVVKKYLADFMIRWMMDRPLTKVKWK